jgi:lantibiotic modifying enzyme
MIVESSNPVSSAPSASHILRGWTPIATPDMRGAALAAVADIARAAPSHIRRYDDGTLDLSFAGGAAGVAVFLHYAAQALDDADAHAASVELLGQALDGLHAVRGAGLFGGFTGVAWAVSHLQKRGVEELDDVDLAKIDALIESLLRRVPWPDDYDLVTGLVGLGVYGLERMDQGAGEGIVTAVVNRLAEMADWVSDVLTSWFHPPWLVPPIYRQAAPEGWYNLGVAHGVPGVLAFLARAARYDVRRASATRLLAAGVRWTCAHVRMDSPDNVRIGHHVDPRAPRELGSEFRDAWCYGSPGAAVALLAAARVLSDDALANVALKLARTAARHNREEAGAMDASLCHGTSGLAHLYGRLHAATGEAVFADAAQRWTGHTLALRTPGEGVGGFSYLTFQNDQKVWVAGSNFLEGSAGIGLALLGMSSSVAPSWDRVLLADPSIPTRAAR